MLVLNQSGSLRAGREEGNRIQAYEGGHGKTYSSHRNSWLKTGGKGTTEHPPIESPLVGGGTGGRFPSGHLIHKPIPRCNKFQINEIASAFQQPLSR